MTIQKKRVTRYSKFCAAQIVDSRCPFVPQQLVLPAKRRMLRLGSPAAAERIRSELYMLRLLTAAGSLVLQKKGRGGLGQQWCTFAWSKRHHAIKKELKKIKES